MKHDAAKPVMTTIGRISGFTDAANGHHKFLGIPYAEPPMGELRFKRTVPKKPFKTDEIFQAKNFGAAGPQVFDPSEGDYEEFTGLKEKNPGRDWIGSEDNLTLNIVVPATDGQKKPVVVWIHGGANWLESSRLYTYHGDDLAARGDVIFVSINYRLGVFGWLDVSVLGGKEYKGSHSNGLYDQITALQWIKDNIAAFGGDAKNITVMGESAGSIDLSWLLANNHLEGLARRVVLMSGIAGLIGLSGDLTHGFTEAYAQEDAKNLLEKLDIHSLESLTSMSTAELMERVTRIVRSSDTLFYMDSIFWPRQSEFTPVDPFRAVQKKNSSSIDVMIGYTAYEMGLWLTWDDTLDTHSSEWAAGKIQDFNEAARSSAASLYRTVFPDLTDGRRAMHMIGDSIFVIPSLWFADSMADQNKNIWMFQFDWQADERRGAMHAADQTFLFNAHDTQAGRHICGIPQDEADRQERLGLTQGMQDAVLGFAIGGDPNFRRNSTVPAWPKYSGSERAVMSFNTRSQIVEDPAGARREWWYENIYAPALKAI